MRWPRRRTGAVNRSTAGSGIEEGGYLYDVVDSEDGEDVKEGNDAACRPNQIFAVSLDHPVLEQDYWKPVVETVQEKL